MENTNPKTPLLANLVTSPGAIREWLTFPVLTFTNKISIRRRTRFFYCLYKSIAYQFTWIPKLYDIMWPMFTLPFQTVIFTAILYIRITSTKTWKWPLKTMSISHSTRCSLSLYIFTNARKAWLRFSGCLRLSTSALFIIAELVAYNMCICVHIESKRT